MKPNAHRVGAMLKRDLMSRKREGNVDALAEIIHVALSHHVENERILTGTP
jgi:hypothetical protein